MKIIILFTGLWLLVAALTAFQLGIEKALLVSMVFITISTFICSIAISRPLTFYESLLTSMASIMLMAVILLGAVQTFKTVHSFLFFTIAFAVMYLGPKMTVSYDSKGSLILASVNVLSLFALSLLALKSFLDSVLIM
jgi:hypothetical protein